MDLLVMIFVGAVSCAVLGGALGYVIGVRVAYRRARREVEKEKHPRDERGRFLREG
jgi:membrane protein YqaA with SNARE-associated domain